MQIIECWDLQELSMNGAPIHKYYMSSEQDARAWLGRNSFSRVDHKVIVILDSLIELQEYDADLLRKQALSKLSDAEKKVLGLS